MPESAPTEPARDERGRVLPGNQLARRKGPKKRADANGLCTLNPKACPPWLAPYAETGAAYALALAARFEAHDDPMTLALIGHAANACTAANAFFQLGAEGDRDAFKLGLKFMQESRLLAVSLSALWAQGKPEREHARADAALATIYNITPIPTPQYDYRGTPANPEPGPEPLPPLPSWTSED